LNCRHFKGLNLQHLFRSTTSDLIS
jgi:hypothetical protein